MPISGCHDLPLATFNLPSRNRPQTNAKESPKPKNQNPSSCRSTGDTQCVDAPERVKESPSKKTKAP